MIKCASPSFLGSASLLSYDSMVDSMLDLIDLVDLMLDFDLRMNWAEFVWAF